MTNKIAIITGGSRGLGRNTATNLIFSAEWMSSSRIARTRKKRTG
jgi:NAD(P)-dependent dehydrogenase (short-subunit alcohol dehydrogenase family)